MPTFLAKSVLLVSLALAAHAADSPETIWTTLPATDNLTWTPCYDDFQCSRLKVPLNYSEPAGETIAIAIIQYPHNSTDYKGPILFNPGGPGGSGVTDAIAVAKGYSAKFGGQFDIVGFDPRGTSRSARVSFFATDAERTQLGAGDIPDLGNSPDAVGRAWSVAHISNKLALQRNNSTLAHINTDQTARDMLRITEAFGQEKLQYYGISYGSVLGATFAAMFPDKVGRLVIDGVVDAENYYATLWSNSLLDSQKTLQGFFDGCHKAGPVACAFYAPSPDAISANLTSLYERLRTSPIPVVGADGNYLVVDYPFVRKTVFRSMYDPYSYFSPLADFLAALALGSEETLSALLSQLQNQTETQTSGDSSTADQALLDMETVLDGGTAVRCNDGDVVPGDLESAKEFYAQLAGEFDFGSMWANQRIGCSGWPDFPKTRFRGPFTGNTSHPILLIGNTADPVTPLASANKMSEGFPGSVVLTQDSFGHTSRIANSPCTLGYLAQYFINGTLPDPETVCSVIDELFSTPSLKSD